MSTPTDDSFRGNNPPDIAILPNPGKMQQLAAQNKLIALDSFLDMSQIHNDYAARGPTLARTRGNCTPSSTRRPTRAPSGTTRRSSPANSYQIPATWKDLMSAVHQIAAVGKYPVVDGRGERLGQRLARRPTGSRRSISTSLAPTCTTSGWRTQFRGPTPASRMPSRRSGRLRTGNALHQRRATVHSGHQLPARQLPALQSPATGLHVLPGRLYREFITTQFTTREARNRLQLLPIPDHQLPV